MMDRVKVTLTLDYVQGRLPRGFNWAQTALFFVARTPFKLVKVEVDITPPPVDTKPK